MSKPPVVIRPAEAEDIARFAKAMIESGRADPGPLPTIKAWVGEVDGRLIGMGGIAFCYGRWVGFLDLTQEARDYKMTLMRTAVRFLDEVREQGVRFIYAVPSLHEPGAARWLRRLGFEPDTVFSLHWRWSARTDG